VKFSVEYGQKAVYAPMYKAYQTIKGVETPDKNTIELKFDTVNPSIFDLLDVLWVLDKETIGAVASGDAGRDPSDSRDTCRVTGWKWSPSRTTGKRGSPTLTE